MIHGRVSLCTLTPWRKVHFLGTMLFDFFFVRPTSPHGSGWGSKTRPTPLSGELSDGRPSRSGRSEESCAQHEKGRDRDLQNSLMINTFAE